MQLAVEKLDAAGYRRFGLEFGAIIAGFFGLLVPWVWDLGYPLWPWIAFAVLGLVGLVLPMLLRPVHWVWMMIGLLLGMVTTPIFLAIMFFLIVFPSGLIMRLFGHDPLKLKLDSDAETYRVKHVINPEEKLEYPF